jgi:PAS domain S-box-containing protein
MTHGDMFIEREESRSNLWLFMIFITAVLALLINILSLSYGHNDVAPSLFYIPVVISAYWYPNRGPIFAGVISVVYMGLVYYFLGTDAAMLITSSFICYVLIGVSVIVSSLASHMRRNEVKYRGLFNNSQAGVGLIDFSGMSIREVNPRFASMLGYSEQDLAHIPFGDLFVDAEKKEIFFRTLQSSGSIETFEARFRSQKGGDRWMLISAGMLPDNQFVATIIDITDRKNAELALQIRDHAISSSLHAIALLDLNFRITYVNPSLLRLMDYPLEKDLIGKNTGNLVSPGGNFEILKDAVQRKGSWFGEIALQKSNKSSFSVLLWMNMVKDESGSPVCIMASFFDITERKQMEIARKKALGQIGKNIEQFAILGDNIRNPLAVIVGLSSMAPGEITEKIILQAREIDHIVTQLDKAWIESEKIRDFIEKNYLTGPVDTVVPKDEVFRDEPSGKTGRS